MYGADITIDNLPQEINRDEQAISFKKGCYLGQEVVARMHARGQVAKKLVGLRVRGDALPIAGAGALVKRDDHPAALVHYARAMDAAQEVGDHNMVTSVLSMKSHLAWSERDPPRAIGLAAAGRRERCAEQ